LEAFAASLHPVFFAAALAFILTFLVEELPLASARKPAEATPETGADKVTEVA
jgi:hypothetical protein